MNGENWLQQYQEDLKYHEQEMVQLAELREKVIRLQMFQVDSLTERLDESQAQCLRLIQLAAQRFTFSEIMTAVNGESEENF